MTQLLRACHSDAESIVLLSVYLYDNLDVHDRTCMECRIWLKKFTIIFQHTHYN